MTGFSCEGCGRAVPFGELSQVVRVAGRTWLCRTCACRAYGSVPVDVVQQVAEDRAKHAGGPKVALTEAR